MRSALIMLCLLVGITLVTAKTSWGQGSYSARPGQQNFYRPAPLPRPTVSPYLGLLGSRNNRNSLGLNYFNIVRPDIQTRDALQRQQAQQNQLADALRAQQQQPKTFDPNTQPGGDPITGASRSLPPTGHSTSLMNLQGRFLTR